MPMSMSLDKHTYIICGFHILKNFSATTTKYISTFSLKDRDPEEHLGVSNERARPNLLRAFYLHLVVWGSLR